MVQINIHFDNQDLDTITNGFVHMMKDLFSNNSEKPDFSLLYTKKILNNGETECGLSLMLVHQDIKIANNIMNMAEAYIKGYINAKSVS